MQEVASHPGARKLDGGGLGEEQESGEVEEGEGGASASEERGQQGGQEAGGGDDDVHSSWSLPWLRFGWPRGFP
jgi:hypothetical protein